MRDREENHQVTQASVLDRLMDDEPGVSREPVQYRYASLGQVKASVVRDLENLLNTRRNITALPREYKQLNRSLFGYGVMDFTTQNPRNPAVQQQLRLDIARTIEVFEPRLQNVTVHVETDNDSLQSVHFRITALLTVESESEPVSFDTYFDVNRGEYVITK
jgi:type VI secretion system protein ImpF